MDFSYQLYSSREFGPLEKTLKMLADLGYTQTEGFGGVYEDAAKTKDLLDQNKLTMPSGHFFPVGAFEGAALNDTLASARTLGMERLYCPAPEDDLRESGDSGAWRDLALRLNEAGKKVKDAGFRFGWHNHHWEFMDLPDGRLGMDIILEFAPEIEWEMDVAWVVRGGADPLHWIEKHGDRITTAHVKDIAPQGENLDEDGWADVGHGTMDWPGLYQALKKAGVDLFVMEHDKPNDDLRFAQRSIASAMKF